MLKKLSVLLLLFVFTIGAVAGCSPAADEPSPDPGNGNDAPAEAVEITWFHYKDTVVDGFDAIFRGFNDTYPNLSVDQEMISTEYNTVLMTKINAGSTPDLFVVSPGERALAPYIDEGVIQDVSGMEIMSRLPASVVDSVRHSDGNIYSIPFLNTARGVIYNEAIFEQAGVTSVPRTLSEMREAAEKIEAIGVTPFGISGADGWSLGSLPWQIAQEHFSTPEWIEDKWAGNASFADNAEPAFGFLDLMLEFTHDRPMDTDFMEKVTKFATGEVAMIVQGPWATDMAIDLDPDMAQNAKMMAMPVSENPADARLYLDTDMYLVVGADADLDAIDKLLLYIYEGGGRDIFAEQVRTINAFGIDFDSHATNESIFEYINAGDVIAVFQYNNMPDGFWQANANVMQEYVLGNVDRAGAMRMLDEEWASMVRD